jgi:hypothetical protein
MDYTLHAKGKNSFDRVFSANNIKLSAQGMSLAVKKSTDNKYTSASIGTRRLKKLFTIILLLNKTP